MGERIQIILYKGLYSVFETLSVGADAAQVRVGGGGLHCRLVGAVETEMARREKEGCQHPLRARGLGAMERKERKIILEEGATSAQLLTTIKQIANLWIETRARHLGN